MAGVIQKQVGYIKDGAFVNNLDKGEKKTSYVLSGELNKDYGEGAFKALLEVHGETVTPKEGDAFKALKKVQVGNSFITPDSKVVTGLMEEFKGQFEAGSGDFGRAIVEKLGKIYGAEVYKKFVNEGEPKIQTLGKDNQIFEKDSLYVIKSDNFDEMKEKGAFSVTVISEKIEMPFDFQVKANVEAKGLTGEERTAAIQSTFDTFINDAISEVKGPEENGIER